MKLKQIFSVGTVILSRGSGSILQFVLNIILGHILGAKGLGYYYTFFSWHRVTATLTSLGMPIYVLKNVSTMESRGEILKANNLVKRSLKVTLLSSILFIALTLIGEFLITKGIFPENKYMLIIGLSVIAGGIYGILRIKAETLKAKRFFNLGLSMEFSFTPFVVMILIITSIMLSFPLSIERVLIFYVISLIISVLISLYLVFHQKRNNKELINGDYKKHEINYKETTTYLFILLINSLLAQAPYFILPFFASTSEIGGFGAAHRLTSLAGTILIALASYFNPLFVRYNEAGNEKKLYNVLKLSMFFSFIAFAPFFVLYMFFSETVLKLFGAELQDATIILAILTCGSFINAIFGLSEHFLNMTGKHNYEFISGVSSVLLLGVLSLVLGNVYGVRGIAFAYAISFGFRSIFSFAVIILTRNKLTVTQG